MKLEHIFRVIGASMYAAFIYLFGYDAEIQRTVIVLFLAMGFDILTGIIKAARNHNISSYKWHDGIFKKIGMVLCLVFGAILDIYHVIDIGVSFTITVAGYFLIGEAISVLENIIGMGVKLPDQLIKFMEKGQQPLNGGGEEIGE
jgi:toxin secretion/phage lysis holin